MTTAKNWAWTLTFLLLSHLCTLSAHAQSKADFYKGKTVTVIVGYTAGGGYDLYARLLSRHLARHIPGTPNVIVQNMPGAAGLVAANYIYSVTPKDGLFIAAVDQNIPMFQLLGGAGVHYDVRNFNWLGSVSSSNGVVISWAASGLKTLDDLLKRPVSMGTTGSNDDAYVYGTTLNALLDAKLKLIRGYNGTSSVNVAIESGEVEAMSRSSYFGFASQKPDWIRDHKVNFIVQLGLTKQAELPDVPLLRDVVKTEEQRQIADNVTLPTSIGYNYWMAPGIPSERISTLQQAFSDTVKDPAFLDDAKKQRLEIVYKSSSELKDLITRTLNAPSAVREKASAMLGWKN